MIVKLVTKKLGLSRQLTQFEHDYIEKWIIDFSFSFDIIEIALKKTTSKVNPSFDYIDKLLSDWHERGFKTANQVENFLADMKQKAKNIKQLEKSADYVKSEKQSSYQKYEQRSYDNLNYLYANKKTTNLPNTASSFINSLDANSNNYEQT